MNCLLGLSVAAVLCAVTYAQDACLTPVQKTGACVPLFTCNSLVTQLRKQPLLPADRQYLARSQCGWSGQQPKVCCPDGIPQKQPQGNTQPQTTPSRTSLLPKAPICGSDNEDRIYGGEATKIDEYPWLVLIEYTKPSGKGFHCGGVLINNRYVLTASHCVNSAELPKTWTLTGVRLGEWNLETDTDCDNGDCSDPVVDIAVEEKIPHPQYGPSSDQQYNDIALLRLARTVDFTYFIKPICLPTDTQLRNKNPVNEKFVVAGWGKTETRGQSNLKLKVAVNGVDYDRCNQVYSSQKRRIIDSQICAGGDKGKDSCRGDSGGPLMGAFKDARGSSYTYLAGLVSYGPSPCGMEGWPGVYTRVSNFIDWIEQTIRP